MAGCTVPPEYLISSAAIVADFMGLKCLDSHEYQIILEQRYLCFKSWEKISVDLGYSIQHTFRLHDAALTDLERFYKDES